jgi:hypothetical protein
MKGFKIFSVTANEITFGWPDESPRQYRIRDKDLVQMEMAINEAKMLRRQASTASPSIYPPNAGPTQILGK